MYNILFASNNFAISDIMKGMMLFRYWLYVAFIKLQLDHQKTKISIFWQPLTAFFVATILSLVWSKILNIGSLGDYFFYILIGFSIWSLLIAKLINRGVSSLARRSGELTNTTRPISSLALEDIGYSFLNFFTTLPFILAACAVMFDLSWLMVLLFICGLTLMWVTAMGLSMTLGVFVFFYRDVLLVTRAIMRLGFLVTPIIWKPERLGEYEHLIYFNPFYSFMDLCRSPLMGQLPNNVSWYISVGLSIFFAASGVLVLNIFGTRIRREAFVQ